MSVWNDTELWPRLCSGSACPICQRGRPLDIIATLDAIWVTMREAGPVQGYVCLVSRHAVELHDLSAGEAAAFITDASKVSKALASVTDAVKINYEIHGNSLPHLHMYLFPRYRGDQFEGKAIDPRAAIQPVYRQGGFERIRDSLVGPIPR